MVAVSENSESSLFRALRMVVLLSAPVLAYTKGTERIAYGALMLQDIKKSIHFFQDDMKGSR